MKRKIAVLLFLGTLLLLSTIVNGSALEYFEILNYDIQIDVMDNNSYDISETIKVEYSEPRHGIYRFIPRKHNDLTVKITDISVPGYDYTINRDAGDDYINIRIGSPDYLVDGIKTYQINYTYTMGKDFISELDEFYFNLIGPDWATTIQDATFTITMPHEFDASKLNVTSGRYGSSDTTNTYYDVSGLTITGGINGPLGPNEGLTVALTLPEGYYQSAKDNNAGFYIMRYLMYGLCVLLVVWAYFTWSRHGRDIQLTPVVGFYPPDGMTPAEVGYIVDGTIDNQDIISLIIYWASKGFLRIEEHSEQDDSLFGRLKKPDTSFSFIKLRDANQEMQPFEATMFTQLFEYGDGETVHDVDLEKAFYVTVNATRSMIINSYKSSDRRLYTKKSVGKQALTMLSSILPAFMMILALLYLELGFGLILVGFSLMLGLVYVMPIMFIMGFGLSRMNLQPGFKFGSVMIVVIAGIPSLLIGFIISMTTLLSFIDVIAVVGASVALNMLGMAMPQRSDFATDRLNKILGFKNFLLYAEKPRLEALVEQNPEYFYDTMAYAMVLGVSDKWAEKFESIALEPPNWYQGYQPNYFRASLFGRHLVSSMSSMQTTMTSMPTRSRSGGGGSSFGGGFSGGGGGGGGGGSW